MWKHKVYYFVLSHKSVQSKDDSLGLSKRRI